MNDKTLLAIAEAIRVAYLRGSRDPEKKNMTGTVRELSAYVVREASK